MLDTFCKAGGVAKGYARAGFEVIGVDIEPQPHYPFEFHEADAMYVLALMEGGGRPFGRCNAIHASPPRQGYTTMNNRHGADNTPRMIGKTRALLEATGLPWVIENVLGAKSEMRNPIRLTGEMFDLRVHRPRLFESNVPLIAPKGAGRQKNPVAIYGREDGRRLWTRKDGSELRVANLETASDAMGIDWMTWDEIREAIPPSYTEYVGCQLLDSLVAETA